MNLSKRILTRCSLVIVFSGAFACGPEGDLKRTIHPVSKKFTDRQTPSSAPAEADAGLKASAVEVTQLKGLPSTCSSDSDKKLCIHCMSEHWAIERCYDFKGKLQAESDCFHTNDHVKCLTKAPPFALYLDHRSSHEKFLRENYLVWQETVHQIWDDKLLPEAKTESDRLLSSLDWLTLILSTKSEIGNDDFETWAKLQGLEGKSQALGQNLLVSLQEQRLAGKLTLASFLDSIGIFYIQAHGASDLWEDLRTMSLEGLED